MTNIIYFSHGGGPLPILGEPSHKEMISFMKKLPEELDKPKAIIVISAHWEEEVPTIIGNNNPSLYYDYYGFPKEAYEIKYPAHGNVEFAKQIKQLFEKNNIQAVIDDKRGLDHGVFIPLLLMYPEADIPVIQISLVKGLRPKEHLSIGKAMNQLLEEDILVIGSGFSFHNMKAFDWSGGNERDEKNDVFQEWLIDVCTGGEYTQREREDKLREWEKAPNARYCHPREEHLMPLHVCCGLSGRRGDIIFDNYILGKRAIAIRWGIG